MPLVAIVGRPNVGKSTLFNRLIEARQAIVHDKPGVTRDRVYGSVEWAGTYFNAVDTGGFVPNSAEQFEAAIREQAHIAIDEADAILFVVDVTTGITDLDAAIAELLRKTHKPVFVVANKADNDERRWQASEFYQLGLREVYPVSAVNGTGTGELLDDLIADLPDRSEEEKQDERLRVAVIGKPNVGKSSFTNAILGFPRSIVTEISGTTRDAVHSIIEFEGREMVLIDTAGLRKKSRVKENIEFYSALRTQRAVEECDVAVLLLDAVEGLQAQDIRVLKQAEALRKGLVIAVNKWDLVEKETNTARDYQRFIYERLPMLDYVPVLFISAATRKRVYNVLNTVIEIDAQRQRRIPTAKLNEVMLKAIERHHPPTYRNQFVKIKYVTQVAENPPVFAFFCNYPRGVKEEYRRYLENKLREAYGFVGVPLTLVFKAKSKERA